MVKAAKNYQMKACPCCHGEGQGLFASGTRWICSNCDGAGKVSIFPPPAPLLPSRIEPLLDARS